MEGSFDEKSLVFVSFYDEDYSRSSVLRFSSPNSLFIKLKNQKILMQILKLRRELQTNQFIIVMSPSHMVVILIRVLLKNIIILDAGWPLLDGVLFRTFKKYERPVKILKAYFVDFFAFHLSHLVLLESMAQVDHVRRTYGVPKSKLKKSYTGFLEVKDLNESIEPCILGKDCPACGNSKNRIILFRGRYNAEAGIEKLVLAARKINSDNIKVVIVMTGFDGAFNDEDKILLINKFVSREALSHLYSNAALTVGQLGDNSRLDRTIPHKAFEAGYFGKTYLTRKTLGIMELYSSHEAVLLTDTEVENLDQIINSLIQNPSRILEYETNISLAYRRKASQNVIFQEFFQLLNKNFKS